MIIRRTDVKVVAGMIGQLDELHVIHRTGLALIQIPRLTPRTDGRLELIAKGQDTAGETIAEDEAPIQAGFIGDFPELDLRLAVFSLDPDAIDAKFIGVRRCVVLRRIHVGVILKARPTDPVFVDGDDGIELELHFLPLVSRTIRRVADVIIRRLGVAVPPILVADPAFPLHVVHLFLQGGDTDAEAI